MNCYLRYDWCTTQHQAAPKNILIQIQKEKLATLISYYECVAKYNFDGKTCLILLYMIEFLKAIIFFLDSNNIKYMLSGSIALGALHYQEQPEISILLSK